MTASLIGVFEKRIYLVNHEPVWINFSEPVTGSNGAIYLLFRWVDKKGKRHEGHIRKSHAERYYAAEETT